MPNEITGVVSYADQVLSGGWVEGFCDKELVSLSVSDLTEEYRFPWTKGWKGNDASPCFLDLPSGLDNTFKLKA
jgi:hypothetical protein